MLSILIDGVSTRQHEKEPPEMAEKAGVNKLPVSRESIDAGARRRKSPSERDFSEKDLPIIYIDGIQFDRFHVLAAVDVDAEGDTHVPELRDGAARTPRSSKACWKT